MRREILVFGCANCGEKVRGWLPLRKHTKEKHGREPYYVRDVNITTHSVAILTAYPDLSQAA